MKLKFKFYDIYQNIDSKDHNYYKVSIYPCIDNNHIEYLLLNEDWLKISEKYDMNIVVKKENEKCGICFENMINCQNECGHSFCFTCIYSWLNKNQSCPYCRVEIDNIGNLELVL